MKQKKSKTVKETNWDIYAKASPISGMGLFAGRTIPAGKVIVEYIGERISKTLGKKRVREGNTFIFALGRQEDIDGSGEDNIARFANHSCDPNAEMIFQSDSLFLRSLRRIEKDEEITYDYQCAYSDEADPCTCGAKNCIGIIVHQKYRYKVRGGREGYTPRAWDGVHEGMGSHKG